MVCVCWGVGSGKITHLLEIHIKKFTSEILSSLLYENKGKTGVVDAGERHTRIY